MNLTRSQQIALGGGVALVISSFLPWYGAFGYSINAWDSQFWAWGGVLFGVAAAAVVALDVFGAVRFTVGRIGMAQLALVLAVTGFALVLIRLLTESRAVDFGLYVGLVATAAIAYGTFANWRESGAGLNPFAPASAGLPVPPPAGAWPDSGSVAIPDPPVPAGVPAPPPAAVSTPPPAAVPPPAPIVPPKPAAPPPPPAFVEYWFYVIEAAPLVSTGGYTVAQLNPGAWYLASSEKDGWVETSTDDGAAGWVAASAVNRQA
jgi:hypothetical protein